MDKEQEQMQPGGHRETVEEAVSKVLNDISARGSSGQQGLQMQQQTAIGTEQVREALATLNEYKQGKANLEQRIIENEQWYKLRHWECMRRKAQQGRPNQVEPSSGWLFNAIANKHADAMDNFPRPNVQPREPGDQEEARRLSSILPVIMDNCEFEDVYDQVSDYKLKAGTGIYGVFWDSSKLGGLGDISIRKVDILNLFWESGITDIQQSRNVFFVELVDNDLLSDQYPELKNKLGGQSILTSQYIYDDTVRTDKKSAVVDWYYKKWQDGKMVLHFCKFVNDTVLFATENEPDYQARGWYDHGLYPFVFDPLYRTAGTPCGFSYIDIAKSAQEYIDRGNQAILQNMLVNARPRHFIRTDGSVNEAEYADITKDFVHVEGNLGEDSIRPVYQGRPLAGTYVSVINNKVDELKEITGNRDISTGGTSSGVTAASAIAAMQEAGSKLSRDSNKASHRAFRKVCLMVIELIRQFYDLPRQFRITGEMGQQDFVSYSNAGIRPQNQGMEMGVDMGVRVPLFDVYVTSEKASPYSRMSANEMALQFYSVGFFNPQLYDQALACLNMMDFDKKDQLMQIIAQNGQAYRMAQMQMAAMQQGGPMAAPAEEEPPAPRGGRPKENAGGESSITRNARQRVANASDPG